MVRTDREAIKALGWLSLSAVIFYALFWWMDGSISEINHNFYFLMLAFLVVMLAPEQCLMAAKMESYKGLAHSRRRLEGSASGLALIVLAGFPGLLRQNGHIGDYRYALIVGGITVLSVTLFHLSMVYPRRLIFKGLIFRGLKIAGFSLLFSLIFGVIAKLTFVQMVMYFLVVLGVASNLILPSNSRLRANVAKANPFARKVIKAMTRLAFSSGVSIAMALPFVATGELSTSGFLSLFVIAFIGHWVVTRHSEESIRLQS